MPPSPKSAPVTPSTPKNTIHGVIIALLVLSVITLLAIFFRADMADKRAEMSAGELVNRLDRVEQELMAKKAAEKPSENIPASAWVTFSDWDLTFKHPEGWQVEVVEDSFVDGQDNVVLTSSKGRLASAESSGGPGEAGVTYFTDGFQANMGELATAQDLGKLTATNYPNIQKVTPCDEAGCPSEEYVFTGKKSRYRITINYTGSAADYKSVVENLLASIKE